MVATGSEENAISLNLSLITAVVSAAKIPSRRSDQKVRERRTKRFDSLKQAEMI